MVCFRLAPHRGIEDGYRAQDRDALVLDVHRYLVGIARILALSQEPRGTEKDAPNFAELSMNVGQARIASSLVYGLGGAFNGAFAGTTGVGHLDLVGRQIRNG